MSKGVVSKDEDYSQWYNDLVVKADMAEYSPVKGCMIIKPYGYSIFNLDAMTMLCQILSDQDHDLWNFKTADGKCIQKGIEYLYPFLADKGKWPLPQDVMYWEFWPVAQPALLLGANAFQKTQWFDTWKSLDHFPKNEEVIRNLPVRNPIIWFN